MDPTIAAKLIEQAIALLYKEDRDNCITTLNIVTEALKASAAAAPRAGARAR